MIRDDKAGNEPAEEVGNVTIGRHPGESRGRNEEGVKPSIFDRNAGLDSISYNPPCRMV